MGLVRLDHEPAPATTPPTGTTWIYIDSADGILTTKNSSGVYKKYPTSTEVAVLIATALTNYDLSSVVDSKIADAIALLIDGAPAALDTLNELAAALADDANFAATVTNALALKADSADLGALAFLNQADTADIVDGAVTNDKIGTNAITAVKINDNSVLNSKAADMPATTLKGNDTGATADPKDLTVLEAKTMLALENVSNTSDADKPISTATQDALDLKYDASNPNSYETTSQLNTRDTNNRDRANHTGTQLSSTVSDFTEASQDAAASMITGATHDGVSVSYNDAGNTLAIANTDKGSVARTAHEAASDPHPQYLTPAEGNAAYQPLDADLTALAGQTGAGFSVRTGTNSWATRSLTTPGGSGLSITNQDGVFGSPAFTNTDKGSTAVATHEAAADPHPQYLTPAEGDAAYTPLSHVGSGGAQHAAATTSVAGFMSASDKTKLDGVAASATNTPLASTAPSNLGASAAVGTGTTAARADHVHAFPTATQVGAEPAVTGTTSADYYRGDKTFQPLNKAAVGLSNVDNTSDLSKPISTATQAALDGKQPLDADLTAIAALATNGIFVRTGAGAAAIRSIAAGTGISVANSDGVSGNPTVTNSDTGSSAVATHVGLADPHTQYALESDVATSLSGKANLAGGNTFTGDQTINGGLTVTSTTQGFLLPRMTSAQRLAIVSPAAGLMVYDTDLATRCVYAGTHWTFEYDIATTAIQTSTVVTYANITGLVTASLEAGLYALRLRGSMQSTATTTGVGLRLAAGTATISEVSVDWTFNQAGAGTDKNFEYQQISLTDNVVSTATTVANANFIVQGDGVFRISAGGTVAIQLRSEIAASGVSIRPNSCVIFRKVGN